MEKVEKNLFHFKKVSKTHGTKNTPRHEYFLEIFFDLLKGLSGLEIFHVPTHELARIYGAARQTGLDFEDAIQYASAKQLKIPIMTYDKDFLKTDVVCLTPKKFLS